MIALSANHRYARGTGPAGRHPWPARPRSLPVWTHFRLGLNIWYFARAGAISYVLKVRASMVQEVGVGGPHAAARRPVQAVYFMSSFN